MAAVRRGRRLPAWSGGRRAIGQHTAEFVLVMGVVTLAAVAMQLVVRRAVQGGIQGVSDTVLGVPDASNDANESDAAANMELQVQVNQRVDQVGDSEFRRVTTVQETILGHSVNEDVQFRFLPEPAPEENP